MVKHENKSETNTTENKVLSKFLKNTTVYVEKIVNNKISLEQTF